MATPLIAHWPAGISAERNNRLLENYGYLPDFMATCVELAKAHYPGQYKDRTVQPMEGKSLVSLLKNRDTEIHTDPIAWEHEGNRALRQGKWKISWAGANRKWELYDMVADRTEMNDLATVMPEKRDELVKIWNDWAARVGVRVGGKAKKKKK